MHEPHIVKPPKSRNIKIEKHEVTCNIRFCDIIILFRTTCKSNTVQQWFLLRRLWNSFLDLRHTSKKMLIKRHIINFYRLYIIDENTMKMTLIFGLICIFVQIKINH